MIAQNSGKTSCTHSIFGRWTGPLPINSTANDNNAPTIRIDQAGSGPTASPIRAETSKMVKIEPTPAAAASPRLACPRKARIQPGRLRIAMVSKAVRKLIILGARLAAGVNQIYKVSAYHPEQPNNR